MQKGVCKLCLEYKDLCKESHIIPKFLYKLLAGKNNLLVYLDTKRAHFKHNSEYEGGILCEKCDSGIIGKLDDYAAKFLHGEFPNQVPHRYEYIEGQECIVRENDPSYDYARFKLFLLSLLWRGSISSRPFFQQLKLRPEVEEELRVMIKDNTPGEPDEYACFVCLPPLLPTPDGGRGFYLTYMPTMSPISSEIDGLEMTRFVIEGTHYFFITSKPAGMNVAPSLERDKLTIGFSSVEEQAKLQQQIIQTMQKHQRRTV